MYPLKEYPPKSSRRLFLGAFRRNPVLRIIRNIQLVDAFLDRNKGLIINYPEKSQQIRIHMHKYMKNTYLSSGIW